MDSLLSKDIARDSNIECLRVICFIFVLIHHIIAHVIYKVDIVMWPSPVIDTNIAISIIINSLCYVGVNCFMLISGYYGIKVSVKGIIKLYILLSFYALIQSRGNWLSTLLPLSHYASNHWWFMKCYVIFYLMSPIIRFDHLSKKQHRVVILLLIFINVYLGFYWDIYTNGYTVAQFLFMYSIGNYIKKYVELENKNRYCFLFAYIGGGILCGVLTISSKIISIPHWHAIEYNNPVLVVASLSLFMFFLSLSFRSGFVNIVAKSAISIYLMQDFDFFREIYRKYDHLTALVLLIPVFIVIALLVDQIRLLLQRVLMGLVNLVGRKYNIDIKTLKL